MAKGIKARKADLYVLHQLMKKIPDDKFADNNLKIINFFRALKKVLRKSLDEVSDLNKAKESKLEEETKLVREIFPQITRLEKQANLTAEDRAELQRLKDEYKAIDEKAAEKVKPETDRLKAIEEEMNDEKKKIEVVFDNEDFNFIEGLFQKSSQAIFKVEGKEIMDLDTMDMVLSLFEGAYNPDAK